MRSFLTTTLGLAVALGQPVLGSPAPFKGERGAAVGVAVGVNVKVGDPQEVKGHNKDDHPYTGKPIKQLPVAVRALHKEPVSARTNDNGLVSGDYPHPPFYFVDRPGKFNTTTGELADPPHIDNPHDKGTSRAKMSKMARRDLASDAEALKTLKSSITKDPQNVTSKWGVGNDPCKWSSDALNCAANPFAGNKLALAGVDLNQAHLEGDLTFDFLLQLTDLTFFHANSNNFKGSLPLDLSAIKYLYELDVSNNKLSGPFPTGVLSAKNLTLLDLRFNAFTGPVPAELFTHDLDVLFLNDNKFDGAIPANLGVTPALYVTLANNGFSGSIPLGVGEAKNLKEILFNNNKLSGYLPDVWTGPKNLTLVDVSNNQLIGGVPEALCQVPTLEVLNVTGNYLMQPLGPACAALEKKKVLHVSNNCIPGLENQKSTAACSVIVSH